MEFLFYVVLILSLGYNLHAAVNWRRATSIGESMALSLALGLGGVGLVLFWCSLAGLRPSPALLLVLGLGSGVLSLVALVGRRRERPPTGECAGRDKYGACFLALGAMLVFLVCAFSALSMMYEWDAFAIWGLKGKVLAHEAIRYTGHFHNRQMGMSHLPYPLMVPFQLAGYYGLAGSFDETLGKLVFGLTYLALAMLLHLGLRQSLKDPWALGATVLFAATPRLLGWAGSGYADLSVALFFAGNVLYLWKWQTSRNWRDVVLAGLFGGAVAFTKNEGSVLAALSGLTCLGVCLSGTERRAAAKHLGAYFLVVALAILPFLLWRQGVPPDYEDYGARLGLGAFAVNPRRVWTVAAFCLRDVSRVADWGGAWVLLALAATIGWRGFRQRQTVWLWLLTAAVLGAYVAVFVISPHDSLAAHLENSMDRLLLHLLPVVVFLAGAHLRAAWQEREETAATSAERPAE